MSDERINIVVLILGMALLNIRWAGWALVGWGILSLLVSFVKHMRTP